MSSFANRKALIKKLEKERSSSVICYVTGDRRQLETQISKEVIDLFIDHLDAIGPTNKLSLVLHTNGGDTGAAWRLINLLHTFCDELEVIIPSKAMSAGTLISLGANRIVMTKQAALGPIDPSINHPLNPLVPNAPQVKVPVSVEAVRGYIDEAKNMGITNEGLVQLLIDLSNKVHPLVLGQIFRSREQIRLLANNLLPRQVDDQVKREAIIDFLCAESGSHDYTINRREAIKLGLNIEKPSTKLYTLLRSLHMSYVEEMKLLEPYDPYSMLSGEAACDYCLSRAAIESLKVGSHQFVSEGNLTKTSVTQNTQFGPVPQESINDSRKFEGWRKVA